MEHVRRQHMNFGFVEYSKADIEGLVTSCMFSEPIKENFPKLNSSQTQMQTSNAKFHLLLLRNSEDAPHWLVSLRY